jgi:hypothetical protein
MVTRRERYGGMYTEVKRVVVRDGEPEVKETVCCCAYAGATPRECADAKGNKTPCRCDCHRKK